MEIVMRIDWKLLWKSSLAPCALEKTSIHLGVVNVSNTFELFTKFH